MENRIRALTEENRELLEALETERGLVKVLEANLEESNRICDESKEEVAHLNTAMTDMQHDYMDLQRKYEK